MASVLNAAAIVVLSAGAAWAGGFSASAQAAPIYSSWTGCYVGGNVGGAWSAYHFSKPGSFDEGEQTAGGLVGGAQLGCDYQISPAWTVGIQGMIDGADVTGSSESTYVSGHVFKTSIGSFGTFTGRLGYSASPALLFYGKAGVGWVNGRSRLYSDDVLTEQVSFGRSGLDLGAGLAWAFRPHWDLSIEYDHIFLGTQRQTFVGVGSYEPFTENVGQGFDKLLLSVNYHFNAP